MCLETIEDILARLDDRLLCRLDEESTRLRAGLPGGSVAVLDGLEELHRARTREIAGAAMLAGVAMGRGLALFLAQAGNDNAASVD